MSMVEDAAIAAASAYHGRPCGPEYVFGDCTGGAVFVDVARAVLTALMEPNMTMISAAVDAAQKSGNGDFVAIHRAMLTAALEEG